MVFRSQFLLEYRTSALTVKTSCGATYFQVTVHDLASSEIWKEEVDEGPFGFATSLPLDPSAWAL